MDRIIMNVYIDLGCHDGDTILQFRNWRYLHYPPETEWMVYGFDPNPAFEEDWNRHKRPDTVFQQKAAWIEDGTIELSIPANPLGSTIMKEKEVAWQDSTVIEVSTFDFSEWLRQFMNDHVLIKLDIEGSELPVLTKMIEDHTDDIAAMTFVEWHDGKMPQYESNKHDILKNYRGKLVEWR